MVAGSNPAECAFDGVLMLNIIFTFVMTYLLLSVCWFLPDAGTSKFADPTKKELLFIAVRSAIPASMIAFML